MVEVSKNYAILVTLGQAKMHISKWYVLPIVRNRDIHLEICCDLQGCSNDLHFCDLLLFL